MSRRSFALAAVVAGTWLSMAASAVASGAAAADEPAAELALAGPESVVFELAPSGDDLTGTADLLIINSGGLGATVGPGGIWVDDPPGSCAVEVSGDRTTVAADDDAVLSVTVTTDPSCADETGTLVLESDPASDPLSARFSFVKSDSELAYASAPAAAALAALGLAAALFLTKGEAEIDLGAVFSFKDSWLTTVATFTAVLGTILTTTGVIANLLPGLDTDRLLALNLGFGGLVLIAPVVYAALASWGWRDDTDGKRALSALATRPGLVLASATTLAGVVGQLVTTGILVFASTLDDLAQGVLALVLVATGLIVIRYAWAWTAAALRGPAPVGASGRGSGTL